MNYRMGCVLVATFLIMSSYGCANRVIVTEAEKSAVDVSTEQAAISEAGEDQSADIQSDMESTEHLITTLYTEDDVMKYLRSNDNDCSSNGISVEICFNEYIEILDGEINIKCTECEDHYYQGHMVIVDGIEYHFTEEADFERFVEVNRAKADVIQYGVLYLDVVDKLNANIKANKANHNEELITDSELLFTRYETKEAYESARINNYKSKECGVGGFSADFYFSKSDEAKKFKCKDIFQFDE